jgi:hypothetical protein
LNEANELPTNTQNGKSAVICQDEAQFGTRAKRVACWGCSSRRLVEKGDNTLDQRATLIDRDAQMLRVRNAPE